MKKSYLMNLTNEWQTVLDNQDGVITYENFYAVSIRVGGADADAVTLPKEGINFAETTTVEAKNYNNLHVATIGVIK